MALGNIKLRATSANVTTQINGITAISSSQVTNAPLTHEQIDLNFLELANSIVNLSSTEGVTLANQTTTNLVEGTNLYFTNARVDSRVANIAVSNIGTDAVKDTHIDFGTGANQVSTADIPEQTNLYYTDSRVDTRIQSTSINSLSDVVATSPTDGQVLKYVSANSRFELAADVDTNTTDISANTITQLSDVDTTGATTNSILKYNGSAWVVGTDTDTDTTDLSANTTTHLAEGTNLYYTDARVDNRVANIAVSNIAVDAVGNTHIDFANVSVTDFANIGNYLTTTWGANINAGTYTISNLGNVVVSSNVDARTFNANADTSAQVSTFTRDQNSAGTTVRTLNIRAQSSTDMADGYGGSLGFKIKDDTAEEDVGSISVARDGADNTGKFVLTLVNSGSYNEVLSVKADGSSTFTNAVRLASLTQAQRDALAVSNGDIVYNSSAGKLQGYENGSWVNLSGGTADPVTYNVQNISGPGAVDVTSTATFLTTTGTDAYTLADGVEGQLKIITMKVNGGVGTVTPTNFVNGTNIVFNNVEDTITLIYQSTGWVVLARQNATVT